MWVLARGSSSLPFGTIERSATVRWLFIAENQVGTSQGGRLGAYRVSLGASGQVDPYRHWCALEASDKRNGCGVRLHILFI
jgi:hypothetical protein